MKIRAIVSLKTLYQNLGDLTINACLVSQLSLKGQVLCLSSGVPQWYLEEFCKAVGQEAASVEYRADPLSVLAWIGRAIVSGDRFVLVMSPGAVQYTESHQRTFLYIASKIFRSMHFAQVGASYAKLDPKTKRLLRSVAHRRHFLSVRDPASQQELANYGITVPIVPDLAFGLGRAPSLEKRYLVLNFRSSTEETESILVARLLPVIQQARTLGLEPILFWQVAQDRDLALHLSRKLDVPVAPGLASPRPTFSQARKLYERTAAICSNRLHGLLIAAAYGAIPIAMLRASEQKIAQSFRDSGLTALITSRPEDDAELLAQLGQPDAMLRTLDESFRAAQLRIDSYFNELAA